MLDFGIPVNNAISSFADNSEMIWDFAEDTADVMLGEINTDIAPTKYEVVYQPYR